MGWHDHRGSCSRTQPLDIEKEIDIENLPEFPILEINHSRRVYNNNDYTDNGVRKADLKDHIEYNKKMRFGTALFINGICVNYGYLGKERCDKIAKEIIGLDIKVKPSELPYR